MLRTTSTGRYLFLLPSLMFFGGAMLIPFFMGFNIAFTNWDGLAQNYRYIGLSNFRFLFQNRDLMIPIRNTLYFAFLITVSSNGLALMTALLLLKPFRGRNLLRTVFFIPTCLSTVLAAFIWSFVYREVFRNLFGINSPLWSMQSVIPGIVGIHLWNTVSINMIIYLAALLNVPKDIYEAATVDGAGPIMRFRSVTIPMIMPAFTVCVTLTLTYGLREFATVMAATGGGPARASETMAIYIYNHLYAFSRAGYGQAVALVFMIALMIIGYTISRVFRSREVEL